MDSHEKAQKAQKRGFAYGSALTEMVNDFARLVSALLIVSMGFAAGGERLSTLRDECDQLLTILTTIWKKSKSQQKG